MKKLGLIISILALLSPFIIFYLQTDKPDVVYTVSDNIPVSNESANNNIQQVEIKNSGNSTAKGIQLKIDADIKKSRVIQDSESDKVEIYKGRSFELVYSQLPPDGKFTVVIESDIKGLDEKILTIKSEDGNARNGLESNTNIFSLPNIFLTLYILVFSMFNLRSSYTYLKLKRTLNPSRENIEFVFRKKPFYFKEKEWAELLKNFLEVKIQGDLLGRYLEVNIEEWNSYKILIMNDKPNLSEEDWNKIKKEAVDAFKIKIRYYILSPNIFYSDEKVVSFGVSVAEKLGNLPDSLKREISGLISDEYINYKSKQKYFDLKGINKTITEPKPNFVKQENWDNYIEFLSEIQYMFLLQTIFRNYEEPIKVMSQYETKIVKDKDKLNELAYSIEFYRYLLDKLIHKQDYEFKEKPNWIKEEDIQKLNRISSIIVKCNKDIEITGKKNMFINKLITKGELLEDDKPEYFDGYEWEKIIKLSDKLKEIDQFESNHQSRQATLVTEEKEVSKLKEKVRFQLNTIHDLLQNPYTIDRIESYDNYFSKGNYENLEKLAAYLKENDVS
ncbi:hypothetical protein [Peribacillus sp. Bi134]|uniref:hypothetical protein n=1 Tax=Peribacillus sp. Bi134 TaxID=2884272 RepID=UPI001D24308D|nr:hypothetical protein [Peribacillus sp. Bi134]CAH0149228.1 hypothetical protein SRABI134_00721 [Peribacillus sp. Bi134]